MIVRFGLRPSATVKGPSEREWKLGDLTQSLYLPHIALDNSEGGTVHSSTCDIDVDHLKDLLEFSPNEQLEATTVGGLATEVLDLSAAPFPP